MSLKTKFENADMTTLAGIENNNGTTPSSLPHHNLHPTAYTNASITYGNNPSNPGKAMGSSLDLQDSGPINVPDNKHNQSYTHRPGQTYMENLP